MVCREISPGATATLLLTARANQAAQITNFVVISGLTQTDTNAANDNADSSVNVQSADLALGLSADTLVPNVRSNVTFTITLTNLGPSAVSNITVSDVLPENVEYVSHTAGQGSYASGTGLWSVGNLTSNATATLTLTAAMLDWGWHTNTAQVTGATVGDPNAANSTASLGVEGQLVDLDPGKSVDNERPLGLGSNLVFTIVVTNRGPSTATGVELTDLLPTGLGYKTHTPSQGTYDDTTGKWTVGTLASNAVASLSLTTTNSAPGKFTNTLSITALSQSITNTADDTPSVIIYSGGEADLYLTKTVDDDNPESGQKVTFTIKLDNEGPDPATGVTIRDLLPAGLTYSDHYAPSPTTYNPTTGAWTVSSIANGQSLSLILKALVTGSGQLENTAEILASNAADPDPIGNTASVHLSVITINSVSGRVFLDTGSSGGTANDGVMNGGETGLAGVTVKLTDNAGATIYATATTGGGGNYVLNIPSTLTNSVTLKVVEVTPPSHVSTGAQLGNTGGSYQRDSDTVTFTFVPGTTYTGVNFGDVPANAFAPDGQQAALPGSFVVFAHTYTAGSAGTVTFTTTSQSSPSLPGWTQVLFRDANGNSQLDTGEAVISAPIAVTAGQKVNLLVKEFIPVNAPLNAQDLITVTATLAYTDANPALDNVLTRTDLATAGTPTTAGLTLVKAVDKDSALPGETITYTITYLNNGVDVLRNVIIYDQTPAFTVFVSAGTGAFPNNLTAVDLTAPAADASGALKWVFTGTLAPSGTGTVSYSVKVAQ